jgi:hypothetical protein
MAVRGNKVGTFKGQTFYLLPNGKCRHGSKGRIQTLDAFCGGLNRDDVKELQALIEDTTAKVVEVTVMGAEVKRAITPPKPVPEDVLFDFGNCTLYKGGTIRLNGSTFTLGQYLGTLPHPERRSMRKLLRALGFRNYAAVKTEHLN